MNLLAKRVLLLVLAAAFFFACEDPGEIGIQESVPNPFTVNFIDIPLNPKTVYFDSVNSTNTNDLLFGTYTDPNYGVVSAVPYMELSVPEFSFGIPENAVFDSLILFLDVNYAYGPSVTEIIEFDAVRFEGNIDTRLYFTKDSLETRFSLGLERATFGSKVFAYAPRESNVISVKFKDEFGSQLMTNIIDDRDSTFIRQDRFREFISGIKLVTSNNSGGIFGFDPVSDSTKLALFYHYEDLGLMFNDTHEFTVRRGFNSITSDFTGTVFENLTLTNRTEIDPVPELVYHNPSLGFFLKLDLSGFHEFKDTAENIIVNRADLILDMDESLVELDPPQEIRFYQVDRDLDFIISDFSFIPRSLHFESQQVLAEPTIADRPYDFAYDSINIEYSEQVTLYVNNLLSEKISDTTLLTQELAPLRDGTKNDSIYYNRVNTVNQFVIPKQGVRLRVYYSKFE